MGNERTTVEALILNMMRGFPSSQGSVTEGVLASYVSACEGMSTEAVHHACRRFLIGDVPGHNNAFMPTAAELSEQVKIFDGVLRQVARSKEEQPKLIAVPIGQELPPGAVPLGPLSVDFGRGKIDMSAMTLAEKEEIIRNNGVFPADPEKVKPLLQRMGGRVTAGAPESDREAG